MIRISDNNRTGYRNEVLLVRIISMVLFLSAGSFLYGQQVTSLSQYIMNGFVVNPSLAGRDGYTSVNLAVKKQWLGIKEAPGTYIAGFQTALLGNGFRLGSNKIRRGVSRPAKAGRVGVGASIFNDKNAIVRRSGVKFDYAYHIPLGKKLDGQSDLSIGMGLTAYQFALRTDLLQYSYDDDPYLNTFDKSSFVTDFSFGMSFTTMKYYAAFSMTNISRGSLVFGDRSDARYGELGHYYLTGGFNLELAKYWYLKPSVLIKSSDMIFNSVQMDLTTRLFYKENYWGGLSFRTQEAIVALMGFHYDKFYFANAFDILISDVKNRSFGSVEFSVAMKFGESSRRYSWLNAF